MHSCAECVVRDRDGKLLLLGNVAVVQKMSSHQLDVPGS